MDDHEKTLRDAASEVMAQRWDREGILCPCCGQRAKVYRRTITGSMARVMFAMYARGRTEWHNVPVLMRETPYLQGAAGQGGDWAKLVYWGLVERIEENRGDGSPRCGIAKLNEKGIGFMERRATVRRYAYVYDGECVGFDGSDMGIDDALPKDFVYRDIL